MTILSSDSTLRHEAERPLELMRHLDLPYENDRLEVWFSDEDAAFASSLLGPPERRCSSFVVALAPGARQPKRCWPIERYLLSASWIRRRQEVRILVVGGSDDAELGRALAAGLGDVVLNMAGRATMGQTSALLRYARLFIGSDSAPMHVAAALGVPVVEVSCHPKDGDPSHPNSPLRFGPWRVPHIVLQPETSLPPCKYRCSAAEAHCIRQISVEDVCIAVDRLLEATTGNTNC
jgi:heptosyltransferase-2